MIQTIEDIKDRLKSISLYLRTHPDYALLNDQEIIDNVDSLEDVIIYIDVIVKKENNKE